MSAAAGPAPATEPVPQRLLRVATRLFAEKGFETTSVQEIVDAAGVTKGAMYHYFDSKDDLLYEIYVRLLRAQLANLEKIVTSEAPVQGRLRALARDVVYTTLQHVESARIFLRSMHLLDPEKLAQVREERRKYGARFVELVEEGQRDGTFRPGGATPDLRLYYFIGAVHYLTVWYRPNGSASADEIADRFADMLLDSLI